MNPKLLQSIFMEDLKSEIKKFQIPTKEFKDFKAFLHTHVTLFLSDAAKTVFISLQ